MKISTLFIAATSLTSNNILLFLLIINNWSPEEGASGPEEGASETGRGASSTTAAGDINSGHMIAKFSGKVLASLVRITDGSFSPQNFYLDKRSGVY